MRVHEVILRALNGDLTWLQAADSLGRSPRSIVDSDCRDLHDLSTQFGRQDSNRSTMTVQSLVGAGDVAALAKNSRLHTTGAH